MAGRKVRKKSEKLNFPGALRSQWVWVLGDITRPLSAREPRGGQDWDPAPRGPAMGEGFQFDTCPTTGVQIWLLMTVNWWVFLK